MYLSLVHVAAKLQAYSTIVFPTACYECLCILGKQDCKYSTNSSIIEKRPWPASLLIPVKVILIFHLLLLIYSALKTMSSSFMRGWISTPFLVHYFLTLSVRIFISLTVRLLACFHDSRNTGLLGLIVESSIFYFQLLITAQNCKLIVSILFPLGK